MSTNLQIKQLETSKTTFEKQAKDEKDKFTKLERDFERCKIDKAKWETKAQAIEAELSVREWNIFENFHFI